MKVTKLIREYVEEQVSKAYKAKENPYSEQAKIDKQKIKDFEKTLNDIAFNAVSEFLLNNEIFSTYNDEPITASSNPYFYYWQTKAMMDEKKWNEENTRQKNAKIKEIKLALELGANRQELNDMIAKLLEE